MKRLIMALCLGVAFLAGPLMAKEDMGIGVGFATWYAAWRPAWLNWVSGVTLKNELAPAPLYGPVLNLKLPRHFSVTGAFMYGYYVRTNELVLVTSPAVSSYPVVPARSRTPMKRYDVDSTITYSFTKYFRMFAGFKYSTFGMNYNDYMVIPSATSSILWLQRQKRSYRDYAPALGLGVIAPLYRQTLYLLFNLSVIYCFSEASSKGTLYTFSTSMFLGNSQMYLPLRGLAYQYGKVGSNVTLSLAWYIAAIDTTLSVGGRYQVYCLYEGDPMWKKTEPSFEHIFGATVSAMYQFNFTVGGDAQKPAEAH